MISYFTYQKQAKWELEDQCQKYSYLKPWQNHIKCLYTSYDFQLIRKMQAYEGL